MLDMAVMDMIQLRDIRKKALRSSCSMAMSKEKSTIYFTPFSGSSKGKLVKGVQFFFTDYDAAAVTEVQFYVMQAVARLYPDRKAFEEADGIGLFDKVCGSDYVRKTFGKDYRFTDIEDYWRKDVEPFRQMSKKYHLYK